jgi:hypothetical protein
MTQFMIILLEFLHYKIMIIHVVRSTVFLIYSIFKDLLCTCGFKVDKEQKLRLLDQAKEGYLLVAARQT